MKNKNKFQLIKIIKEKKKILYELLLQDQIIKKIINVITNSLKKDGKIFFCGNGGSASDSQHLATEFLVRLRPKINRTSIPAISLTLDSTYLTACSNDFGFKYVFSRSLESLGKKNDVIIAISTSGNSENIIEVLKKAKKMKIFSIGFLGRKGGKAKKYCDLPIIIKNENVARIQEMHIFLGHLVLEEVENNLLRLKLITKNR